MKQLLPLMAMLIIKGAAAQQTACETAINTWHEKRIQDLKSPEGWLNLAGLYWLPEGQTAFGGDTTLAFHVQHTGLPANIGFFERNGGLVTWRSQPGITVMVNGRSAQDAVIFHPDSAKPAAVAYGPLRWFIIKRDDKLGVRLRNLEHPALKSFAGIERFAVDSNWRVQARLQPALTGRLNITNVLGQTTALNTPGKLKFRLQDRDYELDVLEEGNELFIIFGDATSGESTYPSGRFLYAQKPGPDGITMLDFNKAINPPCAFTPFATCPLPPPQNILPVAVTAGEKNYH